MPKFLYFDLGNVLLHFDHERACRGMGDVLGVPSARVREVLFQSGLAWRYELGELSDGEMLEEFARAIGTRGDERRLLAAAGDIFEVNEPMVPVVESLKRAGNRMGDSFEYLLGALGLLALGRYEFISQSFDVHALSFRIKAAKPDLRIYEEAQKLVGVEPAEIFFVDDLEQNIAGARQAGFDAVLYTTTENLVRQLRERGVEGVENKV